MDARKRGHDPMISPKPSNASPAALFALIMLTQVSCRMRVSIINDMCSSGLPVQFGVSNIKLDGPALKCLFRKLGSLAWPGLLYKEGNYSPPKKGCVRQESRAAQRAWHFEAPLSLTCSTAQHVMSTAAELPQVSDQPWRASHMRLDPSPRAHAVDVGRGVVAAELWPSAPQHEAGSQSSWTGVSFCCVLLHPFFVQLHACFGEADLSCVAKVVLRG